jgi:hypothetical protein
MSTTATDLRKNLFQQLELVVDGQPVTFTFKGMKMRIELDPSEPRPSKLSRLIPRKTQLCSDEELLHWSDDLMKELEAKWAKEGEMWYSDLPKEPE